MATYPNRQFEFAQKSTESSSDDVFVMPTSLAQQRFWILDQFEPGNTSLNMPLALSLSGKLDSGVLERTLNEIVSRHEVLRTTFAKNNGKPVQVIAPETSLPLEVLDLRGHKEREAETKRLMMEEAHTKFDLNRGPLFKTKLLRTGSEEHILLLTLHHIICDGWSNGVLVREIGEIYDAFSQGRPSPYDELPIQYADFATWQKDWLGSDGFEDQLAYWKQHLGNELPALEIPTDFPRNKNRASFGSIESLLLPQPLSRAIRALCQREDVTQFMVFLSAFNVLLHRYSGQDNILIGSPTANRQQSETEGLIGAFANTLLLKSDLSGEPSFNELLRRVKDISLGAFSNQSLPFEKLVETVRPASNGRKGGQLFQVLFIFQTAFMQPVELKELSIKPIRSVSPGSIFELSLGVVERQEGTRLQLEYNTDLFKTESIRCMLEDLQSILQSTVLDTNRKIFELLQWTTPLRWQEDKEITRASKTVSPAEVESVPQVAENERVEEVLTKIWQDVLHLDSVRPDDDFFEIGGHSLLAAQLFDEIEKQLGVNLPLATLFTATTIEQLVDLIQKEKPKDVWTSLVPINTSGTKPPLFLMHGAGGNVLFYNNLVKRLGADQPCYGLQAVGLSGHQAAYDRIEDMAAHYIEEIRAIQPKGPYLLGGGSYGGLIAFEVGSQLQKAGDDVELVVMFDTGAPGYSNLAGKRYRLRDRFLTGIDHIQHHFETLLMHESGKKWPYVLSRATRAGRKTRRISKQLKERFAPNFLNRQEVIVSDPLSRVQNAAIQAAKAYFPSQYAGDILLFKASKQNRGIKMDDTLGWSQFATGNLEIREINGIHQSILAEPRVRIVADILSECLSKPGRVKITGDSQNNIG